MSNNLIVERERSLVELERRIAELREASAAQPLDMSSEIAALEEKYQLILRELFGTLSPWEKVHMARHPNRPTSLDYIGRFDRFDELHGDRHFRDDPSIVGGLGTLRGRNVMVLGQQRGRDTKENLHRNFGMPAPEGYRKATRLARLASRLRLPIVTFVDTKGADPGISSEEHAQSEAIAICLQAFSTATVPIVATIVGEGGSGGALALAIADFVIMLEHSTYSVASPEGCAAILWSDASKAEEAAAHLKLTADDLHRFGIVDEVLPEPLGGAHRNARQVVTQTLDAVEAALSPLAALTPETRPPRPPCRRPSAGGGGRPSPGGARRRTVCARNRRRRCGVAPAFGHPRGHRGAATAARRTRTRGAPPSGSGRCHSGNPRSFAPRAAK
jgi:acetyl-CoA carboxylase carboxyl transferase subunit alpha